MSRYIKADMIGCPCGYCEGYAECKAELDSALSIEIVFCKGCKYWTLELDKFQKDDGSIHFCELTEAITKADDFCSYGERSER